MITFRSLSDAEQSDFRKWARENFKPGDVISELWHPVIRAECQLLNRIKEVLSGGAPLPGMTVPR